MKTSLLAVTFDCANAASLATFWSGVLELPSDPGTSEDFASIGLDGGGPHPAWMFVKVPEGATAKNRCHPDLVTSSDLGAEAARVVALGATENAGHEEGGHRWINFTDPEGNVFDIVAG